ncbi:hypothetical protein [Nocardia phage P3.1]|nr:hypothetical protein [Nocardia phage P3.1]
MPKINFGVDGVGKELEGYSGKPPKPGIYTGKLKRLEYTKTKNGQNPGTPMLKAMVVIDGPKSAKEFHGAAVWRNLVIMDSTVGFVNQFLNSLTDGSDTQIKKIQNAFWKENATVVNDEGHITKIGGFKIGSPEGERDVVIQVKNRKYEGAVQAEIGSWIRKNNDSDDEDVDDDDTELEAEVDDDISDDDDSVDESDDDDDDAVDDDDSDDDDSDDDDEAPF